MEIQKDILLKEHTTFRIGGPAKFFCEAKTLDDLKEALTWADEHGQRTFILGGGSNVIFMDGGFNGLVIKIQNSRIKIKNDPSGSLHANGAGTSKLENLERKRIIIQCDAGAKLSQLVKFSIEHELTGLEWAAGIPGMVGGALRGNAGAFSGEMKDCTIKVRVLEFGDGIGLKDAELREFDNKRCEFEYRSSVFKENGKMIIWDCELALGKGDRQRSEEQIGEILRQRKQKQPPPSDYPSVGSIFKNPVVEEKLRRQFEEDKNVKCRADKVPAGWLIEQCDLKGTKIGGALVSPKQANFIVNTGDATAEDVLILISLIKMKVRNEYNVQLEEEAQIVM